MAKKENPLHDNPRSKVKQEEEERVAKKGDKKTIGGQEYESTGDENPGGLSQSRPDPGSKNEWPHEKFDKDGKIEYWRPVKKDVPTS